MKKDYKEIFYLIIMIVAFETVALSSIKLYNITQSTYFLILSMIFYTFICISLSVIFKYETIGVTVAIWSALSVILSLIISKYFFNEQINMYELIGILFVIVGIFIIYYEHL